MDNWREFSSPAVAKGLKRKDWFRFLYSGNEIEKIFRGNIFPGSGKAFYGKNISYLQRKITPPVRKEELL